VFVDEIDAIAGRHARKDPRRRATFEALITQLDGEYVAVLLCPLIFSSLVYWRICMRKNSDLLCIVCNNLLSALEAEDNMRLRFKEVARHKEKHPVWLL